MWWFQKVATVHIYTSFNTQNCESIDAKVKVSKFIFSNYQHIFTFTKKGHNNHKRTENARVKTLERK